MPTMQVLILKTVRTFSSSEGEVAVRKTDEIELGKRHSFHKIDRLPFVYQFFRGVGV